MFQFLYKVLNKILESIQNDKFDFLQFCFSFERVLGYKIIR